MITGGEREKFIWPEKLKGNRSYRQGKTMFGVGENGVARVLLRFRSAQDWGNNRICNDEKGRREERGRRKGWDKI